jgi:hypothetical protein
MVEGQPPLPLAADGHHGDVRRVGHDINAAWLSVLSLVDLGSGLWQYAQQGRFFNDLEMMELGNGDFVAEESGAALARSRAHVSPEMLLLDLNTHPLTAAFLFAHT